MAASQYPQVLAGEILTAALLQSFAPQTVKKAADTSRTSTTVLANDPDLQFTVAASGTYWFSLTIKYEGGTQGSSDFKTGWSVPAGTTMMYHRWGLTTAGAVDVGTVSDQTGTPTFGTNGAGNSRGYTATGSLTASTTPGTAAFQWAQATSNGVATIVHAGSVLLVVRIT